MCELALLKTSSHAQASVGAEAHKHSGVDAPMYMRQIALLRGDSGNSGRTQARRTSAAWCTAEPGLAMTLPSAVAQAPSPAEELKSRGGKLDKVDVGRRFTKAEMRPHFEVRNFSGWACAMVQKQ